MSSASVKHDLSTELLTIIQKDVQQPDMEPFKILYTVVRLYIHALTRMMKVKDDETYAFNCADLVVHIFKIMFQYTKHAKASKDMAERVIVMFQEYIYTSMSLNSIETYLSEIKEFIIDKTVGHIYLFRPFPQKPALATSSKYVFQMESLDILCNFIKSLFLKLISVYKYNQGIQSRSLSTSLFQSLRESRMERKGEQPSNLDMMYFMDDPLTPNEVPEDIQVDYIDIIEEHLITAAILLNINIDKWVLLKKHSIIEPYIHTFLESIEKTDDIIPYMNSLKLRLECLYYGASYYQSIDDSFDEINEILDEYEEDMTIEERQEITDEYIDIQMDIKDFRPFQMRMYRIYDQKNKQV